MIIRIRRLTTEWDKSPTKTIEEETPPLPEGFVRSGVEEMIEKAEKSGDKKELEYWRRVLENAHKEYNIKNEPLEKTIEINVKEQDLKELTYIFKLYGVAYKTIENGVEIDTTERQDQ